MIHINHSDLQNVVKRCKKLYDKSWRCVDLIAADNTVMVYMRGKNDVCLWQSIPAHQDNTAHIAVSFSGLDAIVSGFSDERTDITINDDTITLQQHDRRASIRREPEPAGSLPPALNLNDADITMSGHVLLRMADFVSPAVCRLENRRILMSALLEFGKYGLTATATDGYRLHHIHSIQPAANQEGSFAIWGSALQDICKIINTNEDLAIWNDSDNGAVYVQQDNLLFRLLTPEGRWPDYKAFILANTSRTVDLPVSATIDALKAVQAIAIKSAAHKIRLTFEHNQMTVSADAGGTEMSVMVPVHYNEDTVTALHNAGNLLDTLKAAQKKYGRKGSYSGLRSDRIRFRFNEPTDPLLVEPVHNDQDMSTVIAVVMPMRNPN